MYSVEESKSVEIQKKKKKSIYQGFKDIMIGKWWLIASVFFFFNGSNKLLYSLVVLVTTRSCVYFFPLIILSIYLKHTQKKERGSICCLHKGPQNPR